MPDYPSPVLATEDIPPVAVDSMNATHKEEVELINQLGELLRAAADGAPDDAAISAQLKAWLEHTRAHFERENRLMREYGFPPYAVHAAEHANVLTELETLRDLWEQNHNPEPLTRYVFDRWPAWFDRHVNSMDKVTAQFLSRFIP